VTGGWAFGDYRTSYALDVVSAAGPGPFAVHNVSGSGYTAGLGMEHAMTRNLILRGEYRYTSLGSSTFTSPATGTTELSNKVAINSFLYGLLWKFDGGPVVARY
jgi:outer membrane immunogenic protein